jgi:XapX domain-containing protein
LPLPGELIEEGYFMKTYLVGLGIGLFVGLIYGVLGVRSPAPPLVALVGLLGMLVGEQATAWVQTRVFDKHALTHIADYRPRLSVASPTPDPLFHGSNKETSP